MVHVLSDDRRYCRTTLPRVSRTFAINIRLLDGRLGESVRVGYLLCRAADALEDSWPGTPDELRGRFAAFEAAVAGDGDRARELAAAAAALGSTRDDLALLANLPRVLRVHASLPPPHARAVTEGVTTLASGMARYAARAAGREPGTPWVDTEAELDDYCWVVAGCVGVMLTRLFEAEHGAGDPLIASRRLDLAPIVGRALQLTNILLDWPRDVRRGRCYLPASWLAGAGLTPEDLVGRDRPEVRALANRLEARARAALATVPDYLDRIPPRFVRYRLLCLLPAVWAVGSLRAARLAPEFPWGARRPRLPRSELWRSALTSLLAVRDPRAVRRMFRDLEAAGPVDAYA